MPAGDGPTLSSPGEVDAFEILGDEYRILARSAQTEGRYMIMHARVPPGGGPPRHVHSCEHEGFYILSGVMTFEAAGETFSAAAGAFVNLPPGVAHRFENTGQTDAEMLIFCAPGGIEAFFEAAGEMCRNKTPEPADLAALAARYGIEFV